MVPRASPPRRGGHPERFPGLFDHQVSIQGDEFFELLLLQSGCTDTFTLTTAADLSTAHLVATVPVFNLECDEFTCEPVGDPIDTAVDITWSADEVQTVREHFVSHSLQGDLWCKSNQTRRGLGAFGTATGSVGGVDVGTAEFAEVFSGVMKFNDSCH